MFYIALKLNHTTGFPPCLCNTNSPSEQRKYVDCVLFLLFLSRIKMASDEETPAVVSDNESVTDQLEGSLIEGDIEDEAELMCQICEEKLKEPKLLSCLHAFCQDCLEKQVEEESAPVDGEPTKPLLCPVSCY